jgi:hypothetical protein
LVWMRWLCCVPSDFKFRRKGFEMDIEVRSGGMITAVRSGGLASETVQELNDNI